MLCSVSSRTFNVVSLEVVDCVSLLGGVLVVFIRVNSPLGSSFRVLF